MYGFRYTKAGVKLEMEEASERKRSRYVELVEECCKRGWRPRYLPVEVEVRVFGARPLCKAFSVLGITVAQKRKPSDFRGSRESIKIAVDQEGQTVG